MQELCSRSVWIHVELPGQGVNTSELSSEYPSLQALSDSLADILNQLHTTYVIGFGEGAGANILIRFAMSYPDQVLGLFLIHPIVTSAGFQERYKGKFQLNRAPVNRKNLQMLVEAFHERNNLQPMLKEKLRCDTMLVVGDNSPFHDSVQEMHSHSNVLKCSILAVDNVNEPLSEAPEKVARALLLFCQGLGILSSVSTVERSRSSSSVSSNGIGRRLSMQELDRPRKISIRQHQDEVV
ncbi:hypothetical protein RvY_04088 [Ramazzottius varieornatus]|uniref:Serine aminopeptidase S33 domain-containing protein n=1 Tax=Ramazzottius varieornatus TaxID=947166 RepID=A0A1D1UTU2_RAMVA|nr:hypothetical protein RvY_04088 [Ramazzottius varieornatus]